MLDLLNYNAKTPFIHKHLLTLKDYSKQDIYYILSIALKLKQMKKINTPHQYLKDKTLGMIFQKSSTRTRVSFEVGIYQLGGTALFLSDRDIQLGRGETIEDTAKVLSRYLDGIMIRTYKQTDVEALAEYGTIPIINGLTDQFHPCQILADLMTIYEYKNTLNDLKLSYIGDGNNIANSLLIACSKLGIDIAIACPKAYKPSDEMIEYCRNHAVKNSSKILITEKPEYAIANADVVYTDVWASMGQEADYNRRINDFKGYTIGAKLFSLAKKDAIFLHCLPAHRGEEVTSDVIDGPQSVVFDQAENRLHAQKAVMTLLMSDTFKNKEVKI